MYTRYPLNPQVKCERRIRYGRLHLTPRGDADILRRKSLPSRGFIRPVGRIQTRESRFSWENTQKRRPTKGIRLAVEHSMSRRPLYVRVVVIQQGNQWLAQGLDYNLAAQGPSGDLAMNAFVRILRAHLRRDAQLGREPLAGVPEAPEHFLALWDGSRAKVRPLYREHEAAGTPSAYMLQSQAETQTELH